MIEDDFQTLLVFSEMGIPFYSTRGASQTLKPINSAANLVRDINGELINLSVDRFKLFQSTISCTDQRSPALDNFMPGDVVTVDCVCELCAHGGTGGGTSGISRTMVEGSGREENGFFFYRPRITFMITDFQIEVPDEWENTVSWTMTLEEVKTEEPTA